MVDTRDEGIIKTISSTPKLVFNHPTMEGLYPGNRARLRAINMKATLSVKQPFHSFANYNELVRNISEIAHMRLRYTKLGNDSAR